MTTAALTRLARRSLLPFQRAWLRTRVGRLVLEQVDDISLVVLPDVFNPAVFRTSVELIRVVESAVRPGMTVLDIGTGSGVAAICAARGGAAVIAVDSNPEAVRCARINALLNRVDDRLEVRSGDLVEPVTGERFDLVVCNPPFFRGRPRHMRDSAWRSEHFIERFASALGSVLNPDGRALIVFSSDGDERALMQSCAEHGFDATVARATDFGNEVVTVYCFTPQGARS